MTNYSTWLNFVEKEIVSDEIHHQIKESWQLSKTMNIPYDESCVEDKIDQQLVEQLDGCHHNHISFVKQYMGKIAEGIMEECQFAIFLINHEGYLLNLVSNFDYSTKRKLGIEIGSRWNIEKRGTTAAGIALKYKDPIGVRGAEHYQKRYHQYMTIGLPIFDTEGKTIYVLNLILPEGPWPRVIDALMMTAVQGIEREIYHYEYKQKIEALNQQLDEQNHLYRVQANLLNHIFDNVSDMVFTMDKNENFINVNWSAKQLLQYAKATNLTDVYRNLHITDFSDRPIPKVKDPVYRVFNGDFSKNCEICIHFPNKKKYYYMDAIPFKDHQGRDFAIGILKNVTDFTELEKLKNQYKVKAEELENVINTISDGLAIVNPNGEYTLLNPACEEIFQYKRFIQGDRYYAGMSLAYGKVLEVDGKPCSSEEYPVFKVLQGEKIQNQIVKFERNNEIKYISFSGIPVTDDNGSLEYAVICCSDITKIQDQKVLISQNSQFIKSIMESVGAPIVVVKYPQCTFESANSTYYRFIEEITGKGLVEAELLGKSFEEVLDVAEAKNWRTLANSIAHDKKSFDSRLIHFKNSKGEDKHFQVIYTPVMNDEGEITYITAVGIDITNQINAKKEAEDLAKMKEEYFSVISHELRSPISVVHSAIQLLTGELYAQDFSSGALKMLKKIEKNTYRLLRLVNNFLDITKAEAGYMKVSYSNIKIAILTESLLESIHPIALRRNIEINFINLCGNIVAAVDPEKYERILLNLLSNAIKFSNRDGKITVVLQDDEESIMVSVKDNGIGIPKSKQEKIFDRFYIVDGSLSRKNDGTGIGLSLVKKFVELMEGEINLISEEGNGCEFVVRLPKKMHIGATSLELNEFNDSISEKIQTEFADIKG